MAKMIECYVKRTVQKSITIGGDKVKNYVKLVVPVKDQSNAAIIFHKHVLSSDHELYQKYGYKLLKSFKGKGLYLQVSSFKLKSFNEIINWINSL
jgi:hypothetical protein